MGVRGSYYNNLIKVFRNGKEDSSISASSYITQTINPGGSGNIRIDAVKASHWWYCVNNQTFAEATCSAGGTVGSYSIASNQTGTFFMDKLIYNYSWEYAY